MRIALVCLLLAGCVTYTPDTVTKASDRDLCYTFMHPQNPNYMSTVVYEELKRRNSPCLQYAKERNDQIGVGVIVPVK